MVISDNKFVALSYELRSNGEQGELMEKVDGDSPLSFLYGAGAMLDKFESNLVGLKQGDEFRFALTPEEAYGDFNEEAIVGLPLSIFERDGTIDYELVKVGNTIPMQDAQGNRLKGIVLEHNDQEVKMDFNHPLAGKDLHFSGKVLEVREATEEEINQMYSGGCGSGCGCGSGGEEHAHEHAHAHADGGCGCGSGGCGC